MKIRKEKMNSSRCQYHIIKNNKIRKCKKKKKEGEYCTIHIKKINKFYEELGKCMICGEECNINTQVCIWCRK